MTELMYVGIGTDVRTGPPSRWFWRDSRTRLTRKPKLLVRITKVLKSVFFRGHSSVQFGSVLAAVLTAPTTVSLIPAESWVG